MAREGLTRDAEKFIERLVTVNPRAAVLVSGAFVEHRVLTLLTDRISGGRKEKRKEIRRFLDERFTIGPLVRLATISNVLTDAQARAFNQLLEERNRLAHRYSAWKKFSEEDTANYRKKWKPRCAAVLSFMRETT